MIGGCSVVPPCFRQQWTRASAKVAAAAASSSRSFSSLSSRINPRSSPKTTTATMSSSSSTTAMSSSSCPPSPPTGRINRFVSSALSTLPTTRRPFSSTSTVSAASAAASPSPKSNKKRLTMETLSKSVLQMEYAVRGKVVIAADQIAEQLKASKTATTKYPFDHIVYTNIGNPHSVGQAPLTWPRQVMALVDLPPALGIDHPNVLDFFPKGVVDRAVDVAAALDGHGTGAYSHSKGVKAFRQDVCDFIDRRDGVSAAAGQPKTDPEHVFLTTGASEGIGMVLQALIAHDQCGVMIPIPQYPIYSATLDLLNGKAVGYFLKEEDEWALDVNELERSLQQAKDDGIEVVAMTLINPGNPTGQVLSRENVHDVLKFCSRHNLVLLADEVYQENVYDDNAEFISCKRAAHETGLLQNNQIELVSFHSVSKGVFGECGRRGGYMELAGFNADVVDQFYKLTSSTLCSVVTGQVMVSLMVRGPDPDVDPISYELHTTEQQAVFRSLQKRAALVGDGLNAIPGFSCQPVRGAMYAFPRMELPQGAIAEAQKQGVSPDTLYALSLLEKTGICVVPASGFGQEEGRYGFRTTILPPEAEMERAVNEIRKHYTEFCKQYSS